MSATHDWNSGDTIKLVVDRAIDILTDTDLYDLACRVEPFNDLLPAWICACAVPTALSRQSRDLPYNRDRELAEDVVWHFRTRAEKYVCEWQPSSSFEAGLMMDLLDYFEQDGGGVAGTGRLIATVRRYLLSPPEPSDHSSELMPLDAVNTLVEGWILANTAPRMSLAQRRVRRDPRPRKTQIE